jgi:hypothetical protein
MVPYSYQYLKHIDQKKTDLDELIRGKEGACPDGKVRATLSELIVTLPAAMELSGSKLGCSRLLTEGGYGLGDRLLVLVNGPSSSSELRPECLANGFSSSSKLIVTLSPPLELSGSKLGCLRLLTEDKSLPADLAIFKFSSSISASLAA